MDVFVILCPVAFIFMVSPSRATSEKQLAKGPTSVDNDIYMQLLSRVQHLEQRDKEQQAEINKLRTELQTERRRTSMLERRKLELTTRGRQGSEKTGDEVGRQKHPDSRVGSAKDIGGDENARKNEVKRGAMIRRQEEIPVVAFHATLKNTVQHVGVHQMVSFDNVITNIGSAYNSHFGAFVAPVSGVYVFHTTIMVYSHHELHASIVKNNVSAVANLYIRGVESAYGSDSAMAVIRLDKGDDVGVRNNDADKGIHAYSMFSGFLLHEDLPTESIVG